MFNSLKSKIVIVIALFIIVTCFQTLTIALNSFQIEQSALDIRDRSSAVFSKSYELKLAVVQIQQWLTDISATRGLNGLNDGFDQAAAHYSDATAIIQALASLNPEQSNLYAKMSEDIAAYYKTGQRMAQSYVEFGPSAGNKMMGEFDRVSETIQEELSRAMSSAQALSESALNQSIVLAGDLQFWIVVGAVLLTLAIVASGVFLFRWVIGPICNTAALAEHLARGDGDLTRRLDGSREDEIGLVSRNINAFIGKVHDALKKTAMMTAAFGDTSDKLTIAAGSTKTSMQALRTNTQSVAVAAEEMSTTAREIASNASQVSVSTQQTDQLAAEGLSVINQAVRSITLFAQEFNDAAAAIGILRTETNNIGSILDVIRGIAEQTNLLALNAAIEAARAGEQGRGFAVVADEVRALAYRSQESTNEIRELIERLQTQAESATKMIEAGQGKVSATVTQAERAGTTLKMIVDSVNAITDMTAQIATASEEQSAVIEEVNQNLLTVDSLAAGTVQHADVTDSVTMELARALAGVTIEMQQFRFEQDEQIVFQQAKTAHLAWKARLRNFLDGKEHLSQEQAVSHHHCDLGKWYYGTGMERFGQMAEFKAIEQPHEQIHRLIQQVIALRGSGDEARAESVFNEVSALSGHIVERIETLANALK